MGASGMLFAGYLYMVENVGKVPEFTRDSFRRQLNVVLGFSLRELEMEKHSVETVKDRQLRKVQDYLTAQVDPVGRHIAVDMFGVSDEAAASLENPFTDLEIVRSVWRYRGDRRCTSGLSRLDPYISAENEV